MSSSVDVRQWFRATGAAELDRHAREFGITFVGDNGENVKRESVSPLTPQRDVYEFDDSDDCNSVPERYGGIFMLNSAHRSEQDKLLRLLNEGECSVECGDARFSSELRTNARLLSRLKESDDCGVSGEESHCSVVLDPLPSNLLKSLNTKGRISVKDSQSQHSDHSDTNSESVLEQCGARQDHACALRREVARESSARYQRQESLLLPAPHESIDDSEGSRDSSAGVGVERKSRHRKSENPGRAVRSREIYICNDRIRKRSISCSTTSSTGSNISGTKRRKHHHKHRHRRKNRESTPEILVKELPTPRVNPIFLWARQEDTRIVEVLCEDYDKRNRIKLTKTAHGWRAIPRTERLSSTLSSAPLSSLQTVSSPTENDINMLCPRLEPPSDNTNCRNLPVDCDDADEVFYNVDVRKGGTECFKSLEVENNIKDVSLCDNMSSEENILTSTDQKCSVKSDEAYESKGNSDMDIDLLAVKESATSETCGSTRTNDSNFYDMERLSVKAYNEFDDTDFESLSEVDVKLNISDDSEDMKAEHFNNSDTKTCHDKLENTFDIEFPKLKTYDENDGKTEVFIKDQKNEGTDILSSETKNIKMDSLEEIKTENITELDDKKIVELKSDSIESDRKIELNNIVDSDKKMELDDLKTLKCEILDVVVTDINSAENKEEVIDNVSGEVTEVAENHSDKVESINDIRDSEKVCLVSELLPEEGQTSTDSKDKKEIENESEKQDNETDDEVACEPTDLSIPKKYDTEQDMPISRKRKIFANSSSFLLPPLSPPPLSKTSSLSVETPVSPVVVPAHQNKPETKSVFLESLLSSPSKCNQKLLSDLTVLSDFCSDPQSLWNARSPTINMTEERKQPPSENMVHQHKSKFLKPEDITLKNLLSQKPKTSSKSSLEIKPIYASGKDAGLENEKFNKSRLLELLTSTPSPTATSTSETDALTQLKQVLADPDISVPDPLLVPRSCLKELITNPGKEIPRLLSARPELRLPEALAYPNLIRDPDLLVISLSQLQNVLQKSVKQSKEDETGMCNNIAGTFVEWNQFQHQQVALARELLDAQLKQQGRCLKDLTQQELDAATTTTLNQILWLPYLNQLEAAAVACGNTQEFVNLLGTLFPANYSPPGQQINHQPNFSPNSLLAHELKTQLEFQQKMLMWQEAVAQSASCSRSSASGHSKLNSNTGTNEYHRNLAANHFHQEKHILSRTNPTSATISSHRQSANTRPFIAGNGFQQSQLPGSVFSTQQYQHHNRQSHSNQNHQKRTLMSPRARDSQSSMESEYARRLKMHGSSLQNLLTSSYAQKTQNHVPQTTKSHDPHSHNQLNSLSKCSAPNGVTSSTLPRLVPIHQGSVPNYDNISSSKTADRTKVNSTAKLKVKQHLGLIDPSVTPRLLKGMKSETVNPTTSAMMTDLSKTLSYTNNNLWHPLFGSQKNNNSNNPWQWSTVTVNGE